MLSENELKIIGNQVEKASMRIQLDGLLSVLDESLRVKYQTEVFDKVQKVLEIQKPLMEDEQFTLFKELLEIAVIRNEM